MSKYKDYVYIVELEYEEKPDESYRTDLYPFDYSEDALNFVNKVTRTNKGYEKYDMPTAAYLMQVETGKQYVQGEGWIAAWFDIPTMQKK